MSCEFVKVNNEWLPGVNGVSTRYRYIEDAALTLGTSAGVKQRVTRGGRIRIHEVSLRAVQGTNFKALVDNLDSMVTAQVIIMDNPVQEMLVRVPRSAYNPKLTGDTDINRGDITVTFEELVATGGGAV